MPAAQHQPKPYPGPSAGGVYRLRKECFNSALFHLYEKPLMIGEGKG
jgi:hypothetical protein